MKVRTRQRSTIKDRRSKIKARLRLPASPPLALLLTLIFCTLQLSAQKPELIVQTGHPYGVSCFVFSGDSKRLYSGGLDGTVKVWELSSGRQIGGFGQPNEYFVSIALSPDERFVVTGGDKGVVTIWDATTGKPSAHFRGDGLTGAVAFSFDGRFVASSHFNTPDQIRLWDTQTGKESATKFLTDHTGRIRFLSFSLDNQYLISGASDHRLKVWRVADGRLMETHDESYLPGVAVTSDQKFLAGPNKDDDREIKLVELATRKEVRLTGHKFPVINLSFSPDNRVLASCSYENYIKLWDVTTGREIMTLKGLSFPVNRLVRSEDGNILAATNVGSGAGMNQLPAIMSSIIAAGDGGAGSYGKTIRFLRFGDGFEIHSVTVDQIVQDLAFSPDNRLFATVGLDSLIAKDPGKLINIWDVGTGKRVRTLTGHTALVRSIAFSPDGKLLASYSEDRTVKLWNVETGAPVKTFRGYLDDLGIVSFSSDGKTLESGGPKLLKVHNVLTGRLIAQLIGEWAKLRVYVDLRQVIPGEKNADLLAMWVDDNTIEILDIKTRKVVRTLDMNRPESKTYILEEFPRMRTQKDVGSVIYDTWFIDTDGSGRINFFDKRSGDIFASLFFLEDDQWVIAAPDGRFDTNKLEDPRGLHWIMPAAPLDPLSFEIFMRNYYEPDLLPRLLRCRDAGNCDKEFKPVTSLTDLNRTQPTVRIKK